MVLVYSLGHLAHIGVKIMKAGVLLCFQIAVSLHKTTHVGMAVENKMLNWP